MGHVEGESNLEMKCSADEAWYDGTLCVAPTTKNLVVVHFNDFDDEDETFHKDDLRNPKKLRSRVRVRSLQLQDQQCGQVSTGEEICGCLDDGEDRKYYNAKVTAITKSEHAFKDDGEECLCRFEVLWLGGPKKGESTVVGCAEVCLISKEKPEDDPMVKNLLLTFGGNGDQPRRRLIKSAAPAKKVPKSVPSPRPRTPSPSLELAPLKKQPSRESSPAAALANPKVPELARTRSLAVGSKKKRIMQAEEKQNETAAANVNLGMDHCISNAPEDSPKEAAGHGSEREGAGPRERSEGKKGSVEKNRLMKGKAKVIASSEGGVDCEEPAGENVGIRSRTGPLKERLKQNTRRMAAADKAVKGDLVTESLAERVKLKKTAKVVLVGSDSAPAPAPTADADADADASPVRDEAAKPDNKMPVVQSLGERVKLKTAQKSPAGSPLEGSKDRTNLQGSGKPVVRQQTMKRKLREPSLDPMKAKFEKVVKPRTLLSSPVEIVAAKPNNVEAEQPQTQVQKRKAGRPRKHSSREPPAPAADVTRASKNHHPEQVEVPSAQKRSPREEEDFEIVAAIVDTPLPDPATETTKKQPYQEEMPQQHDNNGIISHKSPPEEEEDAQLVSQPNGEQRNEIQLSIREEDDGDGMMDSTPPASTTINDDIAMDFNPSAEEHENPRRVDDATEMSCHMENISIADKIRKIESKYGTNGSSTFSDPQAVLGLMSLAASDHNYRANPPQDPYFRVSPPLTVPLNLDATKPSSQAHINVQAAITAYDDPANSFPHPFRDESAVDWASPKNGCAVRDDAGVGIAKQGDARLLVVENMERDASALDAMQLLQRYTDGVCAVHVLPVLEFQASATGYALYRDRASAATALRWLTSSGRFVVSPRGRPWIVSQARQTYGPKLYGMATYTAYKSTDPDMCGIICDQPHVHDLALVTSDDFSAYFQAQQRSKLFEEHKKWQKELYERIIQHEKKS